MISLFLDTCTSRLIIGIYRDFEELYLKIDETSNDLSRRTLKQIDEALKKTQLSIKDIDRIYVVNGPGSFTGIRVGVTIAKIIAWGLKKEIFPISELELLASTKVKTKYVASMIDARRNAVYASLYDCDLKTIINEEYIPLEKFINKIKRRISLQDVTFISYDNSLIDRIIKPIPDIVSILKKHKIDQSVNCHEINPNYLKKTEAEEKLK